MADLDGRIAGRTGRWQRELDLLKTIPGFGDVVAQAWLAEIGPAPCRHFSSHEKLASWTTLCPGNNISIRKRKHGRTSDAGTYIKIAYQVLKSGVPYQDPGADFCTRRESPDHQRGPPAGQTSTAAQPSPPSGPGFAAARPMGPSFRVSRTHVAVVTLARRPVAGGACGGQMCWQGPSGWPWRLRGGVVGLALRQLDGSGAEAP